MELVPSLFACLAAVCMNSLSVCLSVCPGYCRFATHIKLVTKWKQCPLCGDVFFDPVLPIKMMECEAGRRRCSHLYAALRLLAAGSARLLEGPCLFTPSNWGSRALVMNEAIDCLDLLH